MQIGSIVATVVLAFLMVGLFSAPSQLSYTHSAAAPAHAPAVHLAVLSAPASRSPAVPAPMVGFPRTVLVETFTGVWCIHCPAESKALWNIDLSSQPNVVNIAELHVCAGTTCLENYVPPDGTSTTRGTFYNVPGYPDVLFDGQHASIGATDSTPQMQGVYQRAINNASAFPGNVSIAQTAKVSYGTVSTFVNISSELSGSYNTVSYLLEYIGKVNVSNGYGPHNIGNVVRETLYNHPVTFTNGSTTPLHLTGALNAAWNDANLSVVTFVQQNTTKIVENANMVPVVTLLTTAHAAPTNLSSGANSAITVHVANSSTGSGVSGASVFLSSSAGGTFTPWTGTTATDGSFTSTFTAPIVSSTTAVAILAQATMGTFGIGEATVTVSVSSLVPPSMPTGIAITPGVQQVALNWTAPSTGAGGVSYYVYRSMSPSSGFLAINISQSTYYNDTSVITGQPYWYTVASYDTGGFSSNTTAISANSVTINPTGLSSNVAWWLLIGTQNLSSTGGPMVIWLPDGVFTFTYGTAYYARVASTTIATVLTVQGAPFSVDATFSPALAIIDGTVTPATANVTLAGVAVPVVNGAIHQRVLAGTYTLSVTSPGYATNSTNVTLTPGNVTPVKVDLQPVQSGGGPTSSAMLTTTEIVAIVAVAGAAVVLGAVLLVSQRGKRKRSPPESE